MPIRVRLQTTILNGPPGAWTLNIDAANLSARIGGGLVKFVRLRLDVLREKVIRGLRLCNVCEIE